MLLLVNIWLTIYSPDKIAITYIKTLLRSGLSMQIFYKDSY